MATAAAAASEGNAVGSSSSASLTGSDLSELASRFEERRRRRKSPPSDDASGGARTTGKKAEDEDELPSPLLVYRAGSVLHESRRRALAEGDGGVVVAAYESVAKAYSDMIESLPHRYLSDVVLKDINGAFVDLCGSAGGDGSRETALDSAIRSLEGLYDHSSRARRAGFSIDLCVALASCYDRRASERTGPGWDDRDDGSSSSCMLRTLSALLLHGLILPRSGDAKRRSTDENNVDSHLNKVMEVVQGMTSDGTSRCLGDLQEWQKSRKAQDGTTLVKAVTSTFPETAQRDYLILMLTSCPKSSDNRVGGAENRRTERPKQSDDAPPPKGRKKKQADKKKPPASSNETALHNLVRQVRDVFPDLGEGYVEIALACYGGDASRTISALSETDPSALHPRLRALDRSLPARRKESKSLYDGNDDEEAREVQKARIVASEKQREREAYLLSRMAEYDDDYDDQYDGIGDDGGAAGGIGGADRGMYDVDLDAIKEFNRATREAEKESGFWEESRNVNRENPNKQGQKPKGDAKTDETEDGVVDGDEDDEKKYRGPDKGKGGRLIGPDGRYLPRQKGNKKGKQRAASQTSGGDESSRSPPKGGRQPQKKKGPSGGGGGAGRGGGGRSKSAASDGGGDATLTKLQKRRKNDNKAKVANHHRKERAQKKAAAGM